MATGAYALQAKNNGKALDEAKHPLQGDRKSGKVKWFNTKKGFGFIQCENGEEIFVHYRSIISSGHRILREGEQVSFIISDTEKGPQAENVQKEG
ncbi:MAG: cold shock domain-containing protein [Gammaproteobacteria bacterium]|nr:MAG: cold shock domain-containing protein [Gammaproteobacteria bacterium]